MTSNAEDTLATVGSESEAPLSGLGIKRGFADRAKRVWLHIEFEGVPCLHVAIPVALAKRLITEELR